MKFIKYIFTPNYAKYEGVRPINIYLLRLLYFLMFVGVGFADVVNDHQPPGPVGSHQGRGILRLGGIPDIVYLRADKAAKMAADRDLHDLL